jgi:hypothetical protein
MPPLALRLPARHRTLPDLLRLSATSHELREGGEDDMRMNDGCCDGGCDCGGGACC